MRTRRIGTRDKKIRDGSTCMYVHRILARRISRGNRTTVQTRWPMASGFGCVARDSCADLVSRLADGADSPDRGRGQISFGIDFVRRLISGMSNLEEDSGVVVARHAVNNENP